MEYLILDEYQSSITRGILRNPPTAPVLEFEFPEADIQRVEGVKEMQFIGIDENAPSFHGTVTRRRGNRIAVQKGAELGEDPLDALRVPYEIESFVYPISNNWEGRGRIITKDLSCGAVSFTCDRSLALKEVVEVAVVVRAGAHLIHSKVISKTHNPDGTEQYVGKFISGVEEVEQVIRKEVLYLQLKQRDDNKEGKVSRELLRVDSVIL